MGIDVDKLGAALAGRYGMEREVGRGGMAVVYLARDLRHDRPVAIKVLLPEIAASVGSDRFLREIEIAARLNHPHILTLIDSGKTDGFLYYVMPYVEDETLRARIDREGQLPVNEALRIIREVADGLAYAHGRGLIHRDIKPGNILLFQGHAVLADFGIARALSEAGGERMTRTGVAVGSPVYMSPEQAAGDERVDARSDVYSLGCVLYEMLAGEPPFTGRTPAAIMARKSVDTAPSLGAMRSTAPPNVQAAVEKALAKAPADRFPDANSFADALTAEQGAARTRHRVERRISGLQAAAITIAVAIAAIAWLVLRPSSTSPVVEANTVAIFPFPVTAPDTVLDWLGEGMPHWLEWAFDGVSGPRAADPGTVVRAWEELRTDGSGDVPAEDLRAVAERLGYGLVLTGSVRGTGSIVHLGARLRRVSDGLLIVEVDTSSSADPDSVTRMVDEVAIRLVSVFGGQPPDRASSLMTTSADARRAYLEAQRLLRQGKWVEAVLQFELALGRDSSFALAALGLNTALIWTPEVNIGYDSALTIAWANRAQLSAVDLAIVEARGGGAQGRHLSRQGDELEAWERLTSELAPDRFDAWFGLADDLFHYGALLGVERPIERAWEAFVRAYRADSTMAVWDHRRADLLMHMVDVALFRRDTAALNRYLPEYLASDVAFGKYVHELQASALQGDAAGHDSLVRLMDPEDPGLWVLPLEASEFGFALPEADKAATLLARDPENSGILWRYSLIRGRPAAALRFGDGGPDHFLIRDALYGDGDSAAAATAVARISSAVDAGPPESESTRGVYWSNLCALLQWRLAAGDTSGVEVGSRSLRSLEQPVNQPLWTARAHACAEVLDAWLAVERKDPRVLEMLNRLDVTLRNSPRLSWGRAEALNFATARLWERMGRPERALAAIRRRTVANGWHMYLATMLREEGRLAALVGDRDGAIDAYVKYLELRSDPEPAMQTEAEAVRRELAQLRSDPPGG